MSLINRMLQDLDRRQALDPANAGVVRASAAKPTRREWFWRVLVVLLTAALAWMGWVAVQLLPRKPLATDLAYLAASEARSRPPEKPASPPAAQVPAPAPVVPLGGMDTRECHGERRLCGVDGKCVLQHATRSRHALLIEQQ